MSVDTVYRFDKADYKRLSRESLWKAVDALSLAANIKLTKDNVFKNDYWSSELESQFENYRKSAYCWCVDKKMTPWSASGRNSLPLDKDAWAGTEYINNLHGEYVDHYEALKLNGVFLHKDEFIPFLKSESGFELGDDLWAFVKPKKAADKPPRKLRDDQTDRLVCQGIARTLWEEYKDMTIEEMVKHKAIKNYGNAIQYSDPKTIKGWLSEVDPRDPSKKPGPKKKA